MGGGGDGRTDGREGEKEKGGALIFSKRPLTSQSLQHMPFTMKACKSTVCIRSCFVPCTQKYGAAKWQCTYRVGDIINSLLDVPRLGSPHCPTSNDHDLFHGSACAFTPKSCVSTCHHNIPSGSGGWDQQVYCRSDSRDAENLHTRGAHGGNMKARALVYKIYCVHVCLCAYVRAAGRWVGVGINILQQAEGPTTLSFFCADLFGRNK